MRLGIFATGVFAATVGVVGTAHAQSSPTGIEIGFRTGYSLPMGNLEGATGGGSATAQGDVISGVVPLWFDAGYRFNSHMMIGAFFQYGIAFLNTSANKPLAACAAGGVSCSGNDVMVGAQFAYHIMPENSIDPWVAVGIGYESLNLNVSADGQSSGGSFSGVQFFNIQAGGDYKVMPNLGIGPFLMMSFGQYSGCSVQGASSCTIPAQDMHEWFTIGVRGAYDINLL